MFDVIMRGLLFTISVIMVLLLVLMWIQAGGLPVSAEGWIACIVVNLMMLFGIITPAAIALDKEMWD